MAFQAGGTDYAGFQRSRDRARESTTAALKAKGEADRRARIKESGKRSPFQKLISAGLRGAAAYYTGGLSETMGGGQMIDSAMLGTDSEGRAVRNEYGDLVGTGAAVYQAGKSMKDAKLAKQDAKFDKLRNKRMDIVNTLFDAGMDDKAMEGLKEIENMETGYMSRRKGMEGGWNPFAHSDEDYSALQPTGMNKAQREAREAQLNQAAKGETGQDTSYDTSERKPDFFSRHRKESAPSYNQQNQTHSPHTEYSGVLPSADAKTLDVADVESKGLEQQKALRESLKGMSDKQIAQNRAANSWFSNMDAKDDIVPTWEDKRRLRGPQ